MFEIEKIKIHSISEHLKKPIDVFICSGSFEERCKTIPSQIKLDEVKNVLVCENEDLKEIVRPNSQYLINLFGQKTNHIALRTDEPLFGADNLLAALTNIYKCQPKNFLIDTTTFTHESLLVLLRIIRKIFQNHDGISLQFVYNGAEDYSVGLEPLDKWLSKGIGEIRSVLGYPGTIIPSRKIHLIVLLGFESERAMKLIDAYEPSVTSVGLGEAENSISEHHHAVNLGFYNSLRELYDNIHEFHFSCINPFSTMQMIQEQVNKFPDHNVVIAPMNNKISTIGVALSAISNDSFQICYAHANQYNYEGYSSPSEWCYLFSLPELLHDSISAPHEKKLN